MIEILKNKILYINPLKIYKYKIPIMYIMLTSIKEKRCCILTKRKFYFDLIKVLAMSMVVFNHSHSIISNKNIIVFIIHYLLFYLSKCAVPLFFMVSGALLIGKNDSYKKIIERIIRILAPSILIFLLWLCLNNIFKFDDSFFPYWLWYLMALIAIYLTLPFINKMIINIKNNDYKVFFFLFLIIPSTFYTINIFYNIYTKQTTIFDNQLINNLITMPIAYFVLGFYLKNKKINKNLKNYSIILLAFTLVTETVLAVSLKQNNLSFFLLDSYKSLFVLLMSPTLFVIIKYYFKDYNKVNEFSKLISNLASNSFLIYLFHVFIIGLLIKTSFFQELISFNSLEAALFITFLVILLLDIIFTILKNIPLLKNVLNRFFS